MSWLSEEEAEILQNTRDAAGKLDTLLAASTRIETNLAQLQKDVSQILEVLTDPAVGFKVTTNG